MLAAWRGDLRSGPPSRAPWRTRSITGCARPSRSASPASRPSGVPHGVCTVELQSEWREFLRTLKRHGVRFLLVGAHALAAHGRPRYTQDLDVLVDPTPANARRVAAAIAEFGFERTAQDWRWFAEPYHITMIGRIPLRIDVLTSISGVSFRSAWRNRVVATTTFGDVPVLGISELRANKLASGRPKDLADLALLDELGPSRQPRRGPRRPRGAARAGGRPRAGATRAAGRSRSTRRR